MYGVGVFPQDVNEGVSNFFYGMIACFPELEIGPFSSFWREFIYDKEQCIF